MSEIHNILAMWMPGPFEMAVILIIAVLLFGRRLPEIARGMGKSVTEFKKGITEAKDEVTKQSGIDEVKKEIDETNDVLRAGDDDLNQD